MIASVCICRHMQPCTGVYMLGLHLLHFKIACCTLEQYAPEFYPLHAPYKSMNSTFPFSHLI